MMKVNVDMDILKTLGYEDGVKVLKKLGYYESGSGAPDGAEARAIKPGNYFWTDIYYTLEDENGDEQHIVSFEQEWEKGEESENDKLIREFWEGISE